MGWINELATAPAKVLCTVSGHDYARHGDYLVCEFCGHQVPVKAGRA